MATKRTKRTTKRVKNLAAKKVGTKRASQVKGGGKASFKELNFSHSTDKASPKIY